MFNRVNVPPLLSGKYLGKEVGKPCIDETLIQCTTYLILSTTYSYRMSGRTLLTLYLTLWNLDSKYVLCFWLDPKKHWFNVPYSLLILPHGLMKPWSIETLGRWKCQFSVSFISFITTLRWFMVSSWSTMYYNCITS